MSSAQGTTAKAWYSIARESKQADFLAAHFRELLCHRAPGPYDLTCSTAVMSVRVLARVRPLLATELDKDIIVRTESSQEGKSADLVRVPNPKNQVEEFKFAFNGVYDMPTTQEELFTNEIAPTIKSLFQGLDVTIAAYGVSGSGKTHTMRGGLKLSERGVIPRLLSAVYRRGRKISKDSAGATSVTVTLSYYEIYNDKVYDLFESPESRTATGLPLRERDGKTMVIGLSEHACEDLKDFERLYIEANNNRSTAGTKLNAQSSRSHAILMVKLTQTTEDQTRISTASAIDLAGSEDNRRTENGKERMVESASINKSLFVLSQCIDAIGRGDKRIPYRESKMTRILSLGQNNGITIMILNLAPIRSYHLDTLSSLNVSSRAKRIEVREIENEIVFRQRPKSSATVTGPVVHRQPLRALTNSCNINLSHPPAVSKSEKAPKLFSVYSDKGRSFPCTAMSAASNALLPTSNKRPLEHCTDLPASKIVRSSVSEKPRASGISSAHLEEIVERKVSEILAAHARNQPQPVASDIAINDVVQRRLDELERKIEEGAHQDARSEGLRFLLMAKQHKQWGEDASALKMYELAEPYFPQQAKLQRKMESLRAKIQIKSNGCGSTSHHDLPSKVARVTSPKSMTDEHSAFDTEPAYERACRTLGRDEADYDASYLEGQSVLEEVDEEVGGKIWSKRQARNHADFNGNQKSTTRLDCKAADDYTPRKQRLLDIVNSCDLALIKGLSGVGAKKAQDLIDFMTLQRQETGGKITSLQQLVIMPGIGSRTVERMYEGIMLRV